MEKKDLKHVVFIELHSGFDLDLEYVGLDLGCGGLDFELDSGCVQFLMELDLERLGLNLELQ